jgi:hypothetical protein
MAFPTIPTVAATRVAVANQLNTTATRTFPTLTGFTKDSGDLLIAIVVAYQTSTGTNAAFSGWTGSFTEFHDSATSSTLAMGAAYKWSTGSETGQITVTQAGTITGNASMILLSIPGAHATTPPEAGSRASGTTALANPASFTPSWAADDTLWISVVGSGEDAATSTWTGNGATAPTNFSGWVDTNAADNSAVGECEAAVSFRQENAASQDVGTAAAVDVSNARNGAFVIAVRPVPAAAAVPTDVRVSFPTPSTDLVGSQEFRALVRRKEATPPGVNPTVAVELWESGAKVADVVTGVAVTSTTGQVASGTWAATAIAGISGANVECKVVSAGSSGGTVEVGAIEWNLNRVTPAAADLWPRKRGPQYRR